MFPDFALKEETRNYTVVVEVVDPTGAIQVLEELMLSSRYKDTDAALSAVAGPNGQPCAHGAALDRVPFDLQFECNCRFTVFEGKNCAKKSGRNSTSTSTDASGLQPSVSDSSTSTAIIVIVLSILIIFVGSSGAVYWYRGRREEMKPVNFASKCEILQIS